MEQSLVLTPLMVINWTPKPPEHERLNGYTGGGRNWGKAQLGSAAPGKNIESNRF